MAWDRGSSNKRGYGYGWRVKRKAVLEAHAGLCAACLLVGLVTVATEVDHIVPKAKGGGDEESNLQPLCSDCHRKKSLADKGYKAKAPIGVDGFPSRPGEGQKVKR